MNQIYCKIYDFISCGRIVLFLSTFLCLASCIIITTRGFNWGLDFTGGLLIEVITDQSLDIVTIRDSFIKEKFKNPTIQYLNNSKSIIIRVPLVQQNNNFDQQIKIKILKILRDNITHEFFIQQINWIGPNVSKNLIKTNIVTFLIALLCILIYLTFRFELRLAIATVMSLIHDTIVILGILSFFYIEINLTIIAALISAIGYSLNDNIVIFDRVRENFKYLSKSSFYDIFNISLSQVLNRTIITSITTIMVLLILLFFGGAVLYEFSITLLLGIIIGTISSIYVSSILAFYLKVKHKHLIKKK